MSANVDDVLLLQLLRRVAQLEQRMVAVERLRGSPRETLNTSAEAIMMLVCQGYEVSAERVHSPLRTEEVAWARMVSMYLINTRLGWNHSKIGDHFNRHHTSVGHAMRAVTDRISVDSKVAELIEHINSVLDRAAGEGVNRVETTGV